MPIDPEFLRQVDNAIRSDLQSWRDMFFRLLVGSSLVVAVGVALEGPEVIHEVQNTWRTVKRETRGWVKGVGLLGWILVVIGVAGEGVFELAFSISDGQIQTFDEILTSEAQRIALRAQYENIQIGIELAKEEQATADAEKAAEREKLARLKFEKDYGPRILTKSEQKGIIRRWHRYAGRAVNIENLDDPETIYFTSELIAMLAKAGLKPNQIVRSPSDRFGPGVFIRGSWKEIQMLNEIGDSLVDQGIFAMVQPMGNPEGLPGSFGPDLCNNGGCDFTIAVGFKPVDMKARRPSSYKVFLHNLGTGESRRVK
jgi:hypothetical protein